MYKDIPAALERFVRSQHNAGHFMREDALGDFSDPEAVFHSPLQRRAAEEFLTVLAHYGVMPPDGQKLRILDVGCSIGPFAFALAPYADQVVGFDIEEEAIACALLWKEHAGHHNTEFFVLDAAVAPDRLARFAAFFDVIILKDVIEHMSSMKNVVQLLAVLRPLLRSGGIVYVETPNYLLPFEPHLHMVVPPLASVPFVRRWAHFIGRSGTSDDSFFNTLHIFSPRSFEQVARRLGFRVHNVIVDHKLPRLLASTGNTQASHASVRTPLRFLGAMHLGPLAMWVIARLRLYPTLVYVLK